MKYQKMKSINGMREVQVNIKNATGHVTPNGEHEAIHIPQLIFTHQFFLILFTVH